MVTINSFYCLRQVTPFPTTLESQYFLNTIYLLTATLRVRSISKIAKSNKPTFFSNNSELYNISF